MPNRPLNVVVIGDSVLASQGLALNDKIWMRVCAWLQQQLPGQEIKAFIFAHSGSVIGHPDPVAEGSTHYGVPYGSFPYDKDRADIHDLELPFAFPSLWRQVERARATIDPSQVDLVLLCGGINDVGLFRIYSTDPSVGADWVTRLTTAHCGEPMAALLEHIVSPVTGFPAARVLALEYFQGVSERTDLGLLPQFLAPLLGGLVLIGSLALRAKMSAQSAAFRTESTRLLKEAVARANRVRAGSAVFVPSEFTADHSFAAPHNRLFLFGEGDPAVAQWRRDRCAWAQRGGDLFCNAAATGHPNPNGAFYYHLAVTTQLGPLVAAWRPPVRAMTASVTAGASTGASRTVTITARDAETGALVNGTASISGGAGVVSGPTGTPLTYAPCKVKVGKILEEVACHGGVSASGYASAHFSTAGGDEF